MPIASSPVGSTRRDRTFWKGGDTDNAEQNSGHPRCPHRGRATAEHCMRGFQARSMGDADHQAVLAAADPDRVRSEEHTSELPSLKSLSYDAFCLNKKTE